MGGDAGELDVVVVGAVGVVGVDDAADGGEEGRVAGVEGVVDVGGDGAVLGDEVDRVKGRAEGDVRDGQEAGLRVEVEVAAGVVLAVDGAVEAPDRDGGLAGFRQRPDVDGVGEEVGLPVGAEEVFGVDGEVEDDGGGDDRADGSLGRDGGRGDGVGLVPVLVSGDAVAGALRGLAVATVGIVRDAPQVVEDLRGGRDGAGGHGGLAVDENEDVDLG